MQYQLTFTDEKQNTEIAYIGGKSLLEKNIEWPKNPKGDNLVLIITLSTDYLNEYLGKKFPQNKIISVFTTYNKDDFFLDVISYNSDDSELENIRRGFTKVIIHDIGFVARNDAKFEIPKKHFNLTPFEDVPEYFCGSKMGGKQYLLQNKILKLDYYEYILQIYGNDFPEEYNDIFYLSDSVGYLYLNDMEGIFFTQFT